MNVMFPSDKAKGKAKCDDESGNDAGTSDHRDKKSKKRKDKRVTFVTTAEPRRAHPQGRSQQSQRRDARPRGHQPGEGESPDHFEKLLDGPFPNHAVLVKH